MSPLCGSSVRPVKPSSGSKVGQPSVKKLQLALRNSKKVKNLRLSGSKTLLDELRGFPLPARGRSRSSELDPGSSRAWRKRSESDNEWSVTHSEGRWSWRRRNGRLKPGLTYFA